MPHREIRCPGAAARCVYVQLCWAIWNLTGPTKMTISYDSIQEGKVSALLFVGHQIMPKSWDGLFPNLEGMLGMVRLNRQTVRHAKKSTLWAQIQSHWAYSPAAGSDQRSRCFSYGQLHAVFLHVPPNPMNVLSIPAFCSYLTCSLGYCEN